VVYVARYDVPAHDVKAGQVFRSLDEIPVNVAVTPKFPDP
jgi:hypothetical protein